MQNGSTLWRLAKRVQPPNLTIEQVMMALYDENSGAFVQQLLKLGETLAMTSLRTAKVVPLLNHLSQGSNLLLLLSRVR